MIDFQELVLLFLFFIGGMLFLIGGHFDNYIQKTIRLLKDIRGALNFLRTRAIEEQEAGDE